METGEQRGRERVGGEVGAQGVRCDGAGFEGEEGWMGGGERGEGALRKIETYEATGRR